jgi:hypothetical protein
MKVIDTLAALTMAAAFLACAGGDGGREDGESAVSALANAVTESVTSQSLEAHARAIVQHERPSGSTGENAAIDHVVQTLRAAGVAVEVHTFEAYASDPISAIVEIPRTGLSFEAITVSFSASVPELVAPVVDLGELNDLPSLELGTGERLVLEGEGIESPFTRSHPDLSGSVALVEGLPRNAAATVLARLGAEGIIFVNPEERLNDLIVTSTWGTPSLLNYHRLPDLPVVEIRKSAGEAIRALLAQGPLQIRLGTETDSGWRPMRLAVARIPGFRDDSPYVLFGGHIDAWHHGATDEGASNALMLDLALAFHAQQDLLNRGLVVAWWPGHSNARYAGSTWFADHFFEDLRNRAVAYVNIDLVGQMGAELFGASATASLARLGSTVIRDGVGADIMSVPPGRNSDQSFNGIGLPLLQLHHTRPPEAGGTWWWHTPEDDFDKIDFQVLKTDADLYAHALSTLLASPVLPVDLTATVRALGDALAAHQATAGDRFDLSEGVALQAELLQRAGRIQNALPGHGSPGLDAALLRILRPISRILYVPVTPYHPDSGVGWSLLPGLAPVSILSNERSESDRFRFAEAFLIRERNRLIEALDRASREAGHLLELLESQGS